MFVRGYELDHNVYEICVKVFNYILVITCIYMDLSQYQFYTILVEIPFCVSYILAKPLERYFPFWNIQNILKNNNDIYDFIRKTPCTFCDALKMAR